VTPDVFALPRLVRLADRPRLLRYLIESRRPDVVLVSNSELSYRLLPYLRTRCPEPVYVDYCHMEQEDWRGGGYPRLSMLVRGALDRTGVSSHYLKEWMVSRGAERTAIQVVPTNIDISYWCRDPHARARLRCAWGAREDEPVIVYAARLCEQKRPLALLHTLLALARDGVEYRAIIAGEGELRPQVEAFLREHDLEERVLLLGAVAPDAMRDVLGAADVAFLPTRWEGIALALFEAMAMELAVVASDVGGQRELVTQDCGVLLPAPADERDVAGWVAALEPLLRDPERCRELGRRARTRVASQFRIEQMADAMVTFFQAARAARGRSETPRLPDPFASAWAVQAIECVRLAGAEAAQRDAEALRAAERRLRWIEASRSWRLIQVAKRSLPYRIFARLWYGADRSRGAP
jgi:glycosyltransferase involved in cell wall biosynthesis